VFCRIDPWLADLNAGVSYESASPKRCFDHLCPQESMLWIWYVNHRQSSHYWFRSCWWWL